MRRLAIGLIVLLLAGGAGPAPALAQPASPVLTLLSAEGRRALRLTQIGNQDYVAVDDLAPIFGTTAREAAGGLTLAVRGRTIVLTADQSVVSVGGRLVSLPNPTLRRDGRWFVPVDFLPRGLALALDTPMDLRRPSRLLVVGLLRVPRVVARIDAGSTSTAVTFEITPVTPTRVNSEQGRLVVQFDADALDLVLPTVSPQGFLAGLSAADTPASVTLTLGPRFGAYRSSTSQPDAGSARLRIDLLPAATDLTPAPSAPPPPPLDLRPSVTPTVPSTGLRTVVIDPGHGGDELGAQGPGGMLEKDVALAISKRLRTLIESRLGLRVFLTREDDRTLSLDERAAFANNHQADVFLSVHANAAVRPAMRGAEVYYLSVERADAEARRRADDTAAALPALGGGTRTIDLILWETAQARFMEQSATLADLIQQSLATRVEMSPRAVQQAPFRVLVGANMPAALVEIGYLSNPDQERQLAAPAFQDAVAESLFDALSRFRGLMDRTVQ
jgi:N-acetylmuramoyl-L-alanine amidase